jgi:type I restriction enzyme S subunit
MRLNYRKIGEFIELVDERNIDLAVINLLGLSISKQFIPSVANTIGTDMKNYKIIQKGQFACSIMQVRRDKKMPIALLQYFDEAIISQAYPVFQIKDKKELVPEYLMMWFSRSEFDREACFLAVGGVRGSLEWEDFLEMELPVPSPEKQREIVKDYNTVVNRIALNEQLNQKLEETAQTLYKHWFVDFEFPNEEGKPYKSSGGAMVYNDELDKEIPEGWEVGNLSVFGNIKHGYAFQGEDFSDYETSLILVSPGNFKVKGGFNFTKNKYYSGNIPYDYVLLKDDLVVNMTDLSKKGDTLGNTALIPDLNFKTLLHNQRVGKFDLVDSNYAFFLFLLTNNQDYKNYILGTATGTTVRHTSPTRIGDYQLVIPARQQILNLNSLVNSMLSIIGKIPSQNYHLNELKNLLLSNMTLLKDAKDVA